MTVGLQPSGGGAGPATALGLSLSGRRWTLMEGDRRLGARLAAELGVSPVVGHILAARGISAVDEAWAFLYGGRELLHDPFDLPGLKEAVEHLRLAIAQGRRLWVYGDYDVDGVAATALLYRVLEQLGAQVESYIPSRFDEGYGLNRAALEEAAAGGVHTVVTVDCGVTALEEAAYARALGLHLIITDHHEPKRDLPPALAVIDPKLPGSRYPFAGLSGTGVAFKLAQALCGPERQDLVWEQADLVALATVADMVPLWDENRVLVREGLSLLNRAGGRRPGLEALARVAGVPVGQVNEQHLAFGLGPRVNALGRLGSAGEALELMLTSDPGRAEELARRLDAENRRRQAIEGEIFQAALTEAQQQADQGRKILVLAGEGWHIGVLGIVASRITERFRRPVLMVALEGGEARGSGRSLPGFHLFQALERCADLLVRFGGHAQAAGFELPADLLPVFAARLEEVAAAELTDEDLRPVLRLDGEMQPEDVTEEVARQLAQLAPFGLGNPQPLLVLRGLQVAEARRVGKDGTHLKLRFRSRGRLLDGIAFGLAEAAEAARLAAGHPVDVAALPQLNEWNGRQRVQLMVRDLGQPLTEEPPKVPAAPVAPSASGRLSPQAAPPLPAPAPPAQERPALPAGISYVWSQALPNLSESAHWSPWDPAEEPAAGAARAAGLVPGLDRRGLDAAVSVLGLAGRGTPSLVVAATMGRALSLAAACAARSPHLAGAFVPYHSRLPGALRSLALAEFRQGNAPVLMTSWGGLGGLPPSLVEQVVLADPPLSLAGYDAARRVARTPQGLVWHWDDEGLGLAGSLVDAHCPGREELVRLYLHLKSMVQSGHPITATSAAGSGLSAATVRTGLQVLAELGLLAPPREGEAWTWLPVGRQRLALDASPTFRRSQARKQEFQQALGYLTKVASA